jgi:protocatechuate 3,4-dioxygenase beta subunit
VAATPWNVDEIDEIVATSVARRTTADGRFELPGLSEGRHAVVALDAETVRAVGLVTLPTSEELVLQVGPGLLRLRGLVVDEATGAPVAGAQVDTLNGDFPVAFARTTSDAAGKFVAFAYPGASLRVTASGYSPAVEEVWFDLDLSEGVKRLATDLLGSTKPDVTLRLARGASLSGRVLDPAGSPVPGVTVTLAPVPGERLAAASAVSDATGRYEIRDGPAGRDAVLFAMGRGWISPGLAAAQRRGYVPGSQRLETGASSVVDVAVVRAGAIEGRVVDAGEHAAPGAVVRLGLDRDDSWNHLLAWFQAERSTTAGEEGRFRFGDLLPDGTHLLRASLEGKGTAEAAATTPSGETAVVALVLAGERRIDVRVVAAEDGSPIAGASVTVRSDSPRLWDVPSVVGTTDAAGRASFDRLPAGSLGVYATVKGRRALPVAVPVPDGGEGPRVEVVVRLSRGIELQGRVRRPDGTPVAGARVWVRGLDSSGWAMSGADGAFTVSGLGPGRAEASAQAPGLRGLARVVVGQGDLEIVLEPEVAARPRATVRVLGTDGKVVDSATLVLFDSDLENRWRPDGEQTIEVIEGSWIVATTTDAIAVHGPLAGNEREIEMRLAASRSVAGTVRDEGGKPVRDAFVSARMRLAGKTADTVESRSRSDATGAFRVDGLADLEYELAVVGPPEYAAPEPVVARAGATGVSFVLTTARVIRGRVVDGEGRAVRNATVWYRPAGAPDARWEDAAGGADGGFRIERAVGKLVARAGRVGWRVAEAAPSEVEIPASAVEARLTLPLADLLVVRVDGATDDVRGPAYLSRADAPGSRQAAVVDGVARFADVPPGAYAFWLGPVSGGRSALARGLEPGREHRVPLAAGGAVHGRLVGFDRRYHAQVRIWGPEVFANAFPDDEGRFEIVGLPPGEWEVEAHSWVEDRFLTGKARIPTGGSADISLAEDR